MHLKTILIFSSVCFFAGIMGQGLNAKQICYFQTLVWNHFDIKSIKRGFSCIGIEEDYNDCSLEENINNTMSYSEVAQGLFKILNCMVKVNKWGDNKKVEKLDINNVEKISTKFRHFDKNNNGFLDEEEFTEFIYDYELRDLIGNEVTLNDYENVIYTLTNFRNDIYQKSSLNYDLSDVMLKLLEYKAKFNQTKFDIIEDFDFLLDRANEISQGRQAEDFKSFHEE
ncbi:uncharacterized protein LOC126905987 [Daktulosphaira vitifoliae]|uniref:uncharacterized protein LOC126905987 n=1 Tax=Daktulosphaira vitifoliae TaxID=58002 RepID=UPI0021AABB48|nr:uncharacterized protein LOC126905987 [Daktulosphaira vitifoliae]